MTKIGIIVGSIRKESYSKKVALHVASLLPDEYETELIRIDHLPLYNQDYDDGNNVPTEYADFRKQMKEIDAVLFVTPEYNRSVPGVLKNALDVGSRPIQSSVWNNKPAGIISVSMGTLAGFGANHHLRQSLVFFNMPIVQQPEAYIGRVASILDDEGKIQNEGTIELLQSFAEAFVELIRKH